MTTKYGLIGCGMMGIEHLRNIALLPDVAVVAIVEPNSEQAKLGLRHAPHAMVADSIRDMLRRQDLDAVLIATPNHLHFRQMKEVAANAAIPILCEKPLFTDARDEQEINQFQREYGAPVWVAMEYRYMPPVAAFIEQAETVTGGIKMLSLQEHRFPFLEKVGDWNRFNQKTGGTLVEKCCHFFDLMRLILNSEPVRVSASVTQFVNHLDETYDGETPDIWDGGYVIFDFESGAKAMLELSMFADGSKWNEEIHAIGPSGKIACRMPGPQRFWPKALGPSPQPELSLYPRFPKRPETKRVELDDALVAAGDHHGSTFYQHQRFLKLVREGGEPEVSLEDGKRAVKMGLLAQEAARTQRVIEIKEPASAL
ncbi:MAG: Gfo/Idh/MocA family oxidoreductase [Pseudomonadota bacterium]